MRHIKFGINQPRFYRFWMKKDSFFSFEAKANETDLYIKASLDLMVRRCSPSILSVVEGLKKEALNSIKRHRKPIEGFIRLHPEFKKALVPYPLSKNTPPIIKDMILATKKVGVGPMAAVAGVIADYVGRDLLKKCEEVIVENGGDIFIKVKRPIKIGIYAADSPFTNKLSLDIQPEETPLGICTSSGTIGPSLSFGTSDATIVLAKTATFADACATAVGNLIKNESSIDDAIEYAKRIRGLYGVVVIKGKKMGAWGDVKFCQ